MSADDLNWKAGDFVNRFSKHALPGGSDTDGATIYVGRANVNDIWMPAKLIPDRKIAYVCYNGAEIAVENYEVLRGKEKHFAWVPASHGNVPERAVSTGTDSGEAIFIGRAPYQSSMTVGKVHPSHAAIYIPYGGAEIRLSDYEVLVYTRKPSRRERRRGKRKQRRASQSSTSSSSSSD